VGLAEVADGPIYKVHRYKEYPAGAGEINMAVEDAVRSINRANGAKSADMNVGASEGEGKGFRDDIERRSRRILQASG
jgi:hypothetical protein